VPRIYTKSVEDRELAVGRVSVMSLRERVESTRPCVPSLMFSVFFLVSSVSSVSRAVVAAAVVGVLVPSGPLFAGAQERFCFMLTKRVEMKVGKDERLEIFSSSEYA